MIGASINKKRNNGKSLALGNYMKNTNKEQWRQKQTEQMKQYLHKKIVCVWKCINNRFSYVRWLCFVGYFVKCKSLLWSEKEITFNFFLCGNFSILSFHHDGRVILICPECK